MASTEILTLGHYCHDVLINEKRENTHALGGSVAYSSSFFRALGVKFKIASKVGTDFQYSSFCMDPPLSSGKKNTTSFIDDYSLGERVETVGAICDEILAHEVNTDAQVSIVCGVINEIPVETALKVIQNSKYTICDLQGVLRRVSDHGKIIHIPLRETPYFSILDRFTAIKASLMEAQYFDLDELKYKTKVIITEGAQGATLYDGDRVYKSLAKNVKSIDPTGAGDSFFAGFAYGLLNGFSIERQMDLANYFGSLAVQQVGIPKIERLNLKNLYTS